MTEMTRQRLFGTQLELLLADLMSPPGTNNNRVSRYIVFEDGLDLESLIAAAERAFSEMGLVHYDYEVDSEAAWQLRSERGSAKVDIVNLRNVQDSMKRCLEMVKEDTYRIAPVLDKDDKIKIVVFLLADQDGRRPRVYYHRFHHLQVDGYIAQLVIRRITEIYNAYITRSQPRTAAFLGYAALRDEEDRYVKSGRCDADKAFWSGYLAQYLARTDARPATASELADEPLSLSISIASKVAITRLPIDAITAGIMMTLSQASGVACQMIGMTFKKRNTEYLDRVMIPMSTVLPLWVDLAGSRERDAVVAQVGDAIRQVKQHQFYGGERAIRDLGPAGRDGLYAWTVNYRVFDKQPIIFNQTNSSSHIVATGTITGVRVTVGMQDDVIHLSIESIYRVMYGLEMKALCELVETNLLATLGDGYERPVDPVAKRGYTDVRAPSRGA